MKKTEKIRNQQQGHWLLARLGKRVLRPGGLELTRIMIDNLNITPDDDVIEFAPGLGITAEITCKKMPKSYTGIDMNQEVAEIVRKRVKYDKARVVVANAMETTLPDACANKLYCEAMLTMQSDPNKVAIIKEAARLLRSGGYFGIHEICLIPENISPEIKKSIYHHLYDAIKVNTRPITVSEWDCLLAEAGFKVVKLDLNDMHLLELRRVIADEGLFHTLKIISRALIYPELRSRVFGMRRVFKKYDKSMKAVTILAQKVK